jgi:hypothetical protein
LSSFFTTLPVSYKEEADLHLGTLSSLVDLLDMQDDLPGVPSFGESKVPRYVTNLERTGKVPLLLQLRGKKPILEIAEETGVEEKRIRRFYKYYEQSNASEQAKLQRSSLFNITERLEELYTFISRNLHRLEGVNDEVAVRYVAEMRGCIKDATDLTQKMANYHHYNRFKQRVFELVKDLSPEKRDEFLRRLNDGT